MKPWQTVAVVGVGMIGGSIGLALRKRGLAKRVVGIGRREASLRKAKKVGAVTATSTSLAKGVAEADLIIVCTPVDLIAKQVREVAKHCREGALITDAGSTKAGIVQAVGQKLPNGVRFVGSHPLAGSEKSGPEHATADLFEGRVVIVTPTEAADPVAEEVGLFWVSLGATVMMTDPVAHDCALARTSHLPHLAAAALASQTDMSLLPLTAGGWRDTTRIAAGDPELWAQILRENRKYVLDSLDEYEKTLNAFRSALKRGHTPSLVKLLTEAKQKRDALGS